MTKSELLKSISIEELQERDEFTSMVDTDPGESYCEICACG